MDPRVPRVRLDWEIAKRGWRRYAAYPWATAAGIFTNTIFGLLQAYILLAVYRHRTDVGGFDAGDAVTYVWLAQALIRTVYVFGWQELALRIRDGSIATDLSRPLDPQRYWLAFDLGRAPYHLLFRGVLPFVVGAVVFRLHYPSALDAIVFLPSLALAVVVSLGFRFLYNAAAFWLLDIRAVLVIFHNVPRLGVWSVREVALLYALSSISFALTDLVIGHLDQFPQKIRDGNFDILLVRPRSSFFQVIASDFQLRRLGKAMQGALVLVYALGALHVHWTVGRIALLVVMIPAGVVIFSSI